MTMTYDDSVSVLSFMMAAWPSMKSMADDAANLWVHDLQSLDLDISLTALERMRRTEEFPPSLAKFLGAYQALAPRTFHEARALEAPKFGDQGVLVHALRVGLKLARTDHRNHDKLPSRDCPVCSLHDHDETGRIHLARSTCRRCKAFGEAIYEELRERGVAG